MFESNTLLFSWRARKESVDVCSNKIYSFLSGIAEVSPVFSNLFVVSKRYPEPGLKLSEAKDKLGTILMEKKDKDPDSGFGISVWNAFEGGESVRINILCGEAGGWLDNRCSIGFPTNADIFQALTKQEVITRLVELVVHIFDPECGYLFSSELADKLDDFNAPFPRFGWATYIRQDLGNIEDPGRCADVIGIANSGRLWILRVGNGVGFKADEAQIEAVRKLSGGYNGVAW